MTKTAIIADDDPISRARVEALAIQQNYKIIASVDNGADAVCVFCNTGQTRYFWMYYAKLDGLGVLKNWPISRITNRISLWSLLTGAEIIEHALKLGATDYLIKTPGGLQKGDNLLFD